MEESPNDLVWCLIHISDVTAVLDRYELWKDKPWFHKVDWGLVSGVLDESLSTHGSKPTGMEMWDDVSSVAKKLRKVDQDGLIALLTPEPITVTTVQLTSGGHRLSAMRRQGVATVPGMFHRGDIGVSIRPDQAYRRSFPERR